jgi:hypothetical protein
VGVDERLKRSTVAHKRLEGDRPVPAHSKDQGGEHRYGNKRQEPLQIAVSLPEPGILTLISRFCHATFLAVRRYTGPTRQRSKVTAL